ncbi:zinc metalloproteinase nas-14-like [Ostrinia furnacalis]|uniref:zinc metalloproteinase nas-14-like n=1 Tax=Ostrinia furnacalis TaxID=93504 RepID=UPI00103B962E|nr:zinc metalloproteinase nas-14-like [Ostrinia furnacalis]
MIRLLALSCLLTLVAAGPRVLKTRAEIEEYKTILERTREDDGLTLEDRMEAHPQSNPWENSGKFEGDIFLDDDLIEDLVDNYAAGDDEGRMAYIRPNSRWPSNTVVYEFGANEFNLDQQRYIIQTINLLQERTCVRFRVRNNNDRNFVRLTGRPTGCYASVGFHQNRGIHTLNLARSQPGWGCFNWVVIVHEWYHVLGFFHMQSTYNRYNYVRIHWENIERGMEHNFDRYGNDITSNLGLPYEYSSCMHYGTHFFSSNGRPTLSTTRHYGGVLGQTHMVTGLDIWRLARHYNCPGAWSAAAEMKARTTNYVMKDGQVVEISADNKFADELELLEDNDQVTTGSPTTYNRYNYVRIHWENIERGMEHNFDRYGNDITSNLGLPYEYSSCMHYGTHFFSSNGRPTLSTTRHYGGVLGQTHMVTGLDIWRLARHYNCPGAWSAAAELKARSTNYVMEDGQVVEIPADNKFADEMELLEDNDQV